jgi:hypothetical protein
MEKDKKLQQPGTLQNETAPQDENPMSTPDKTKPGNVKTINDPIEKQSEKKSQKNNRIKTEMKDSQ